MATIINADSTSGGAVITADNSGILQFQGNGTARITLNTSGAVGLGSSPSYGSSGQVLTSGGTGSAPTWTSVGDVTLTGTQTLTNKTLTGMRETRTASSGNNFDLLAANYFTHTVSGTTTFTVSNTAAAGSVSAFVVDLTNGGSATINWWSGMKWAAGVAPTLTASGRDVLGFFTHDGGTTWNGLVLGKDLK